MATVKCLHTHVVIFKRTVIDKWENGIRIRRDDDLKGGKDVVIDFDCKPVKEIYDLSDHPSAGSFLLKN